MWQKFHKFIEKIQNSDEAAKKRWLIGASVVSMVFIITLWLAYIGFIIKPMDFQKSPNSADEFWPIFKNGLLLTGGELGRLITQLSNLAVVRVKNIISIIMNERTITFEQR